jgi:23S rRNA pseudouridine2605 synthase
MPEERLQKILSQAGVTSRRKAEELIVEGRVSVNGKNVTELGSKADIDTDHIKVDGRLLRAPKHLTYIALNKPKECMTTVSDPEGRQTVMHLMRGVRERVFPVGRLDYHSEGLLLLTNDGEFAHRLTAPANHVTKTYVVKVNGALTEAQEKQFREGIPMHGRRTAPAELKRIKHGANPWYEVKITEGRQNQIRIMFKHFGKLVEKLRRVKIGFLELDVAPARYRSLTHQEVEKFRRVLKLREGAEESPDSRLAINAVAESDAIPTSTGTPSVRKPAPKPGRREVGFHKVAASNSGTRKTGPRNAGPRDAPRRDAPRRDVGRRDSGPRNAALRDAGPRDAGAHNTGPRNAGPRNTGSPDAGHRNTAPRNAGRRDAGARKPPRR